MVEAAAAAVGGEDAAPDGKRQPSDAEAGPALKRARREERQEAGAAAAPGEAEAEEAEANAAAAADGDEEQQEEQQEEGQGAPAEQAAAPGGYGAEVVGSKLRVYWKPRSTYYTGVVAEYRPSDG